VGKRADRGLFAWGWNGNKEWRRRQRENAENGSGRQKLEMGVLSEAVPGTDCGLSQRMPQKLTQSAIARITAESLTGFSWVRTTFAHSRRCRHVPVLLVVPTGAQTAA
jgi:hypothetical protein